MNEWRTEDDGDESIMISALEHFSYCPRQCALIHVEATYDENLYTLRGTLAHERVDKLMTRAERGVRVERGLPLWSRRLGLVGRADVVEFRGATPYPIEYKVGTRREWRHEAIQVGAQALCLEEMTGQPTPMGAIYYCGSRMRREVVIDDELRRMVEEAVVGTRLLLREQRLPIAPNDRRCAKCSLLESCLPMVTAKPRMLQMYRAQLFELHDAPEGVE